MGSESVAVMPREQCWMLLNQNYELVLEKGTWWELVARSMRGALPVNQLAFALFDVC